MTRAVALFRDPMRTFLLLAIVVGGYLVVVVPYFGGIDEPAHFSRSYQISTGQFVPEKLGNSEFSGACLPNEVLREMRGYQAAYFKHLISLFPNALTPAESTPGPKPRNRSVRRRTRRSRRSRRSVRRCRTCRSRPPSS